MMTHTHVRKSELAVEDDEMNVDNDYCHDDDDVTDNDTDRQVYRGNNSYNNNTSTACD